MKRLILIPLLSILFTHTKAQTINIAKWTGCVSADYKIVNVYGYHFGYTNVNVTTINTIADIPNYDVIIFNQANISSTDVNAYSDSLVPALVNYIQNGGHVILSTEGKRTTSNKSFMPAVWNALTGDNIIESIPGANGTYSPPRFHNSNGPWGLSPDSVINPSTASYANFINLPSSNITHQRYSTSPTCYTEAVCAVYPLKPKLGDGSLYIQGETMFPFLYTAYSDSLVTNHARALAKMHKTLLTNDQTTLDQLNAWNSPPVGEIKINDTSFCEGGLYPFILDAPKSTSYSWEDNQGNILDTNPSITITDTGLYVLKTVALPGGCYVNDTFKITYDYLTYTTQSTLACSNAANGSIEVNNINCPSPIQYYLNDVSNSDSIFSNLNGGNHEVKIIDNRGCVDSSIVTVGTINAPIAAYAFDTACINNSTTFSDQTNPNGTTITTWEWQMDGTISNQQNPSYTFTSMELFPVTLKVISDNGCQDSITNNISHFKQPTANFGAINACPNRPVTFTNLTSEDGNPYSPGYSFLWNFGDGNLSSLEHPQNTYATSGTYPIHLQVTSNKGCLKDTTLPLVIYEKPVADFSWTEVCFNDPTQFTDNSTISSGSLANWTWLLDNTTTNTQHPSFTFSTSGIQQVKLIVESSNGCIDSVIHPVAVFALPQANFIMDKTSVDNIYNQINFINTSSNSVVSNWSFFDNTTSSMDTLYKTFNLVNVAPCNTYLNQLKVTSPQGCTDSISKELPVEGALQVFVPTAFSPDIDGLNEVLSPVVNDADVNDYSFQIFNRWGELIFETNVITNGWDGKKNGEYLKQDIYVWQIKTRNTCGGAKKQFRGNVSLLR